jgi:hypothetical protein
MKKIGSQESKSPSQLIDARIKELGDWRGEMLSRLRDLVKAIGLYTSSCARKDAFTFNDIALGL